MQGLSGSVVGLMLFAICVVLAGALRLLVDLKSVYVMLKRSTDFQRPVIVEHVLDGLTLRCLEGVSFDPPHQVVTKIGDVLPTGSGLLVFLDAGTVPSWIFANQWSAFKTKMPNYKFSTVIVLLGRSTALARFLRYTRLRHEGMVLADALDPTLLGTVNSMPFLLALTKFSVRGAAHAQAIGHVFEFVKAVGLDPQPGQPAVV